MRKYVLNKERDIGEKECLCYSRKSETTLVRNEMKQFMNEKTLICDATHCFIILLRKHYISYTKNILLVNPTSLKLTLQYCGGH